MNRFEGLTPARGPKSESFAPLPFMERGPVFTPVAESEEQEIRTKQERDGLRHQLESLRLLLSTVAQDSGKILRFQDGKVIDVEILDERARKQQDQIRLRKELRGLHTELTELGSRPEGLFALPAAKRTWDSESTRIGAAIVAAQQELDSNEKWLTYASEDVTSLLSLPEEIQKEFMGSQITGRDLVEALHTRMVSLQNSVLALEQKIQH